MECFIPKKKDIEYSISNKKIWNFQFVKKYEMFDL